MFRRFDRLVPIFNSKQDTLSSYGDIMSYAFFNKKNKNNLKKSHLKKNVKQKI